MKKQIGIITAVTMAVTGMMTIPAPVFADEDPIVVRGCIGSEPDSLDPWLSAASDTDAVFHNVFEGLVLYDETGAIIPGLAESWDISDDGLTYTFHLRDDVTFPQWKTHDGGGCCLHIQCAVRTGRRKGTFFQVSDSYFC